ncbi:hypothetical protein HAX54_006220, partial [Datura stramonium]|nr:hypothetical protein [Datura stramonium]
SAFVTWTGHACSLDFGHYLGMGKAAGRRLAWKGPGREEPLPWHRAIVGATSS